MAACDILLTIMQPVFAFLSHPQKINSQNREFVKSSELCALIFFLVEEWEVNLLAEEVSMNGRISSHYGKSWNVLEQDPWEDAGKAWQAESNPAEETQEFSL